MVWTMICVFILLKVNNMNALSTSYKSEISLSARTINTDISDREKEAAMRKFYTALDTIAGGIFSEFPGVGTFYAFNKAIYTALSDKDTTLWGEIRTHVQQTVDKAISDYNINDIDNQLAMLERGLKEGADVDDLYGKVRDLMEVAFPHKWESVTWSKELALRCALFVPLVIQTYQLNMEKGKISKCQLAERLSEIRENIILGMKEMVRKKYRLVKAKSYSSENVTSVMYSVGSNDEEIQAAILSEGLDTETIKILFKPAKRPARYFPATYHTFQYQINKIKNDVLDFLMKAVVDNVNQFFEKEICMMCPQCPSSITRADINLDWPNDCYDENNKCQHPCGDFSQNERPWCWLHGYYKDHEKYDSCYPIDIRCCITLPFDHNPNRCKKTQNPANEKRLYNISNK